MPRPPAKKRVRRDPDEARAVILDAAERVFADTSPDVAGLKDVAAEADVSHALVSHYFGSYEALVEATLARRIARVRDEVLRELAASDGGARDALLDRVASLAGDRLTIRLASWAFLSGRAQRADFFSAKQRGLAHVVDAIVARRAALGEPTAARGDVELTVVSAITMVLGFGLAKDALLAGLGHPPGSPAAARFEARYRAQVRGLLRDASLRSG